MTTKLTLSVNSKVVSKAKRYAKKKGTSVSKIFEDHIEELTQEGNGKKTDLLDSLKRLRGVAKGAIPDGVNYKDAITDIIIEKVPVMDRLFLDTNILLDFVLDRNPFAEQAELILKLKISHKKRLFVSALSVANVAYFVRKVGKNPIDVVNDIMDWAEIVSLTRIEFSSVAKSSFKDFEDGLQFFSAQQIGADVIITRDVKGFLNILNRGVITNSIFKNFTKMKVGLFFGSFNPIHIGHLIIANIMAETTDLDKVWFVVTPQNPLKSSKSLLHDFDRYDMVRAAVYEHYKLQVSDVEFHLPKPNYTIHPLVHLSEKYPDKQFKVIIGEDNLESLPKWKNYERIVEDYGLYVYPRLQSLGGQARPGVTNSDLKRHPNVKMVEAPMMDISATFIRNCIRNNQSIRYLVPDAVEAIIQDKKFYL